jgi:hypothetical protein
MRPVGVPGRWIWGLSGLATIAALAIRGTLLITFAGVPSLGPTPQAAATRTTTITQRVTSLNVQSYQGPVQVTAEAVRTVRVTEAITYFAPGSGAPPVTQSLSGGILMLADPTCELNDCNVSFAVTVPRDVAVTVSSGGGPISVSGVAGATLDSDGGPVRATGINGPLTVTTGGQPLFVNGLAGSLYADTGGGSLLAQNVAAATATIITGGGEAQIGFTAAPDMVLVSTDAGAATLTVPAGSYALTADSGGGPLLVGIAADPAARRSITVATGGGALQIEPTRHGR